MATYNPRDYVPQFGHIAQAGQQFGAAVAQIPGLIEARKQGITNDQIVAKAVEKYSDAAQYPDGAFGGKTREEILARIKSLPTKGVDIADFATQLDQILVPIETASKTLKDQSAVTGYLGKAQEGVAQPSVSSEQLQQPTGIPRVPEGEQPALGIDANIQNQGLPPTQVDMPNRPMSGQEFTQGALGQLSPEQLKDPRIALQAGLMGQQQTQAQTKSQEAQKVVESARNEVDTAIKDMDENNFPIMSIQIGNKAKEVEAQITAENKSLKKLNDAIRSGKTGDVTKLAIEAGVPPSEATAENVAEALAASETKAATWKAHMKNIDEQMKEAKKNFQEKVDADVAAKNALAGQRFREAAGVDNEDKLRRDLVTARRDLNRLSPTMLNENTGKTDVNPEYADQKILVDQLQSKLPGFGGDSLKKRAILAASQIKATVAESADIAGTGETGVLADAPKARMANEVVRIGQGLQPPISVDKDSVVKALNSGYSLEDIIERIMQESGGF